MFLNKSFLVLLVAILGTSWFSGNGLVAAQGYNQQLMQYQRPTPQNYPSQQPMPQNYPMQQHMPQNYLMQQFMPQNYPMQQSMPQNYPMQQSMPQNYAMQQSMPQHYPMPQPMPLPYAMPYPMPYCSQPPQDSTRDPPLIRWWNSKRDRGQDVVQGTLPTNPANTDAGAKAPVPLQPASTSGYPGSSGDKSSPTTSLKNPGSVNTQTSSLPVPTKQNINEHIVYSQADDTLTKDNSTTSLPPTHPEDAIQNDI